MFKRLYGNGALSRSHDCDGITDWDRAVRILSLSEEWATAKCSKFRNSCKTSWTYGSRPPNEHKFNIGSSPHWPGDDSSDSSPWFWKEEGGRAVYTTQSHGWAKGAHSKTCKEFVQTYQTNPHFLKCIVTEGESWMFENESETKARSWAVEHHHQGSERVSCKNRVSKGCRSLTFYTECNK